jgi:hypothetical protein
VGTNRQRAYSAKYAGFAALVSVAACALVTPLDDLASSNDASLDVSSDASPDASPDVTADAPSTDAAADVDGCTQDCQGGACVAGRCQPVTLVTGQPNPEGLVVGDTDLFWTYSVNPVGGVRRANKVDGGGVATLASLGASCPLALASDEVIAIKNGTTVIGIPDASTTDASSGTSLFTQPAFLEITTVATDGTYLFFVGNNTYDTAGVYAVALGATQASLTAPFSTFATTALTTGNGSAYFFDGSKIGRTTGTGGDTNVVTGVTEVSGLAYTLASSGPLIAWTSASSGTVSIAAADKTSTPPAPIASAQGGPSGIALDASRAYWTNQNDGTIVYCDLANCQPQIAANNQSLPSAIAVDATTIYWLNVSTATILKLAKP